MRQVFNLMNLINHIMMTTILLLHQVFYRQIHANIAQNYYVQKISSKEVAITQPLYQQRKFVKMFTWKKLPDSIPDIILNIIHKIQCNY